MKRTLITTLLALGLVSTAAVADVVVYSGKTGAKTIAGGDSANFVVSTYLVIDLETNQSKSIQYFKFGPIKQYEVLPAVQLDLTQAPDKKNKTSTAFTYNTPATPVGDFEVLESGILLGSDAKKAVVIKTGSEGVSLPTSLKGTGFRTKTATTGEEIKDNEISTVSSVLKLDLKQTKAANDATDEEGNPAPKTLDQTVEALAAALEAKKYENLNLVD